MKFKLKYIEVAVIILLACNTVSAGLLTPVWNFICSLKYTIGIIGGSLVLVMIVYAGIRYVYAADDPGARKQAVSIIINAMIGGLFLVIAYSIIDLFTTYITTAGGASGMC